MGQTKRTNFKGKFADEYKLFKLTIPYLNEFEGTLGNVIKTHYFNSTQDQITVLELGCGYGHTSKIILKSDKRTKITAIDNSMSLVKQAETFLKKSIKKDRVKLVLKDGLEYLKSVPAESFDVFASGLTIHNFDKKYRSSALKEVFRILKPNGLFVNADKYPSDNIEEFKKELKWELNRFNKLAEINRPDLMHKWKKHYLEDMKPNRIMKENVALKEMNKIGFKNTKLIYKKYMLATVIANK